MNTESIRYVGSKNKLIPIILKEVADLNVKYVLDGFSGSTRVGQALKLSGYDVDSNDLAEYSKILGNAYLLNNLPEKHYTGLIDHLNNLPPVVGYFSEFYGGTVGANASSVQSDGKARMWQIHNTMKLDAIRNEIDNLYLTDIEKSVLLTSLMLALDKVDNALGHQVSYLKNWSKRSYETVTLKVPKLIQGAGKYNVFQQDIFNCNNEYDLIYLDPPYGTNNKVTVTTRVRYASYYHLWTTICKNDKPIVKGKSNRRLDASSDRLPGAISVFESTKYDIVKTSIDNLINNLNSKYFLFSYSNKSKVSLDDLLTIFGNHNLIKTIKIPHKENAMKGMTSNKEWLGDMSENIEFLFVIQK
jgi:adenine-specific DNA-methyltransferase